jgi:ComEC/Rec2-related protein
MRQLCIAFNQKRSMINTQKNPLLLVALAFAVGIAVSAFLPTPGFWFLGLVLLFTLTVFVFTKRSINPQIQKVSQASIFLGFIVAGWFLGTNSAIIPQNDPSKFIGQELEVQGNVVDDVRKTTFGYKTILEVTEPMQGKVMLYLPANITPPKVNDQILGTVTLQALTSKNPGFANWLHHQGIHATAKGKEYKKIGENAGFTSMLRNLRNRLSQQLAATFPDSKTAGLSNAMLLGDRTALDGDIRKDFSATGLSHIVAISGMNFAIIYGVLNLLLSPMLYLRRGRQIRTLIVVPMLAFFALLTGGNPAVVRAAIMLGMLDISQAFWSKNNSLNALATSALMFLAFDPQSLFTPDFQLSYAAVLGILLLQNPILHYLHVRLPKLPKLIASALSVTLAAQLATTPFVAWHFQSFPTYFLLANLLVLPLVTLVVQIGFAGFVLAWIPGLNTIWGGVMDFLLWAITGLAELMAQLPGATISAIETNQVGIWVLLAQLIVGFGILERKRIGKAISELKSNTSVQRQVSARIPNQVVAAAIAAGCLLAGFMVL